MVMHKALYPRDDLDGLYVSREKEGRSLAKIEDSVDASIHGVRDYIKKSKGRLINATSNSTDNKRTNRTTITRKQKWEVKQFNITNLRKRSIRLDMIGWERGSAGIYARN